MFIDLLSESARKGGGGGGEFFYRVTKMSHYFEDTFFRIILNFGYLLQTISVNTNS